MNPKYPTVTLSEAKTIVNTLSPRMSVLLLSPPGVGKSEVVMQAAAKAKLDYRSLLGTQIAPEDVSGIPRIEDERSIFCPPRVLLPLNPNPFCLMLDELPACSPDVQKAFYSLLLERRIGEYPLPEGTWVVAAGNRVEDRSLVRSLSSALVNRVIILNVRVDVKEWLQWGYNAGIRHEILSFITFNSDALMRPVPSKAAPFSTPRAWAHLSRAIDLLDKAGELSWPIAEAIAHGLVSPEDAKMFVVFLKTGLGNLKDPIRYLLGTYAMPKDRTHRWFILHGIRHLLLTQWETVLEKKSVRIPEFLRSVSPEERATLLLGLVDKWGQLGADDTIIQTLEDITGIPIL